MEEEDISPPKESDLSLKEGAHADLGTPRQRHTKLPSRISFARKLL